MGAHSTIYITRETARKIAIAHFFKKIEEDSGLEDAADEALSDRLYNCRITYGEKNDDHLVEE